MASDAGMEPAFFSRGLMISLGMHALLAALVLYGGSLQRPAPAPVLTVALVTPAPIQAETGAGKASAGPKPGKPSLSPAPPAPPRQKAARKSPPANKTPTGLRTEPASPELLKPLKPVPPVPAPVVKTSPGPSLSASPLAGPAPLAAAAPGSTGGSPAETTDRSHTGGGGGDGTVYQGAGEGVGAGQGGGVAQVQRQYLNLVRARILAKRSYPSLARERRQEGTVRLRFTLSAEGRLAQGVEVVKPSGFQVLDDQARSCVLAAAPFPPFPRELNRQSLTVELPIVYKITELGI